MASACVFTDIGGRADDKFVWGSRPWVKDR